MTDMELAEEIERHVYKRDRGTVIIPFALYEEESAQIIAALRRGPVCERCQGKGGLADWQGNWRPCPVCQDKRPPSGEMVMVPRELIDRALLWFHTLAENGMDATFSDGERTPNAVAMDDIAAQFSALKDRA